MKRLIAAPLLLFVALAACSRKEAPPVSAPPPSPPAVKGAKLITLAPTTFSEEREVMGTVRASETVTLSSKLMGTILSLPVRVGMGVSKGQVVATIDAREVEAQIAKVAGAQREADETLAELDSADLSAQQAIKAAEAQRELANITLGRYRTLLERGAVSRQEFDEVEARFKTADAETKRAAEARNAITARRGQVKARKEQAAADLAAIKATLSYQTILSPVDGVVVAKPAEAGMLAAPGAPLLVIEEEGKLRLEASAEESMLSAIRVGDRVEAAIDALGAERRSGRVVEIAPVADAASRTVTVKIALDDRRGLRSGYFGRALFPGEQRKVLLAPKSALVEKGQLTGVFTVDPAKVATFTLVRTGREYPQGVEVVSGLSEGAKIVAERVSGLADGSRVE